MGQYYRVLDRETMYRFSKPCLPVAVKLSVTASGLEKSYSSHPHIFIRAQSGHQGITECYDNWAVLSRKVCCFPSVAMDLESVAALKHCQHSYGVSVWAPTSKMPGPHAVQKRHTYMKSWQKLIWHNCEARELPSLVPGDSAWMQDRDTETTRSWSWSKVIPSDHRSGSCYRNGRDLVRTLWDSLTPQTEWSMYSGTKVQQFGRTIL